MAEQKWTPKLVAKRLEEAADILMRMPGAKIQEFAFSWPPIIQEFWKTTGNNRVKMPLPEEISRLDECMEWLHWLRKDCEIQLLWLRANKVLWKQIAPRLGIGRTTAWHHWTAALFQIVTRLNMVEEKNGTNQSPLSPAALGTGQDGVATNDRLQSPRASSVLFQPIWINPEEEKRKGWRNLGILVISEEDHQLTQPEMELVRQLGDRLYGQRNRKEVCHG